MLLEAPQALFLVAMTLHPQLPRTRRSKCQKSSLRLVASLPSFLAVMRLRRLLWSAQVPVECAMHLEASLPLSLALMRLRRLLWIAQLLVECAFLLEALRPL